ncbi:hypothetical protein GCM10022419_079400 [Nonomuraea rosea]|uniref:DUF3562 domain-containing protein n=1 Tax=Nonomuraea rosea TaxID=638574 RepID=A0ABP6YM15_9ACTN
MTATVDQAKREEQAMREVAARLTKTFAPDHSPERVTQIIETVLHRFDGRPIRDFVPVLVERYARQELAVRERVAA